MFTLLFSPHAAIAHNTLSYYLIVAQFIVADSHRPKPNIKFQQCDCFWRLRSILLPLSKRAGVEWTTRERWFPWWIRSQTANASFLIKSLLIRRWLSLVSNAMRHTAYTRFLLSFPTTRADSYTKGRTHANSRWSLSVTHYSFLWSSYVMTAVPLFYVFIWHFHVMAEVMKTLLTVMKMFSVTTHAKMTFLVRSTQSANPIELNSI